MARAAAWRDLLGGVTLDYLPKEFDVLIEATRPSGKPLKVHSKIAAGEPQIKPADK